MERLRGGGFWCRAELSRNLQLYTNLKPFDSPPELFGEHDFLDGQNPFMSYMVLFFMSSFLQAILYLARCTSQGRRKHAPKSATSIMIVQKSLMESKDEKI